MNFMYFWIFYFLIGFIVSGIATSAMRDKSDKYFHQGKLFVTKFLIAMFVMITWPIWVGMWIGNTFK
jgi:hypothetical protein